MDRDLEVTDVKPYLEAAVERASPRGTAIDERRGAISDAFVASHSRFDSFAGLCAASPAERDDAGFLRELDDEELDAFVDETTEFDGWGELRRAAAIADVFEQVD